MTIDQRKLRIEDWRKRIEETFTSDSGIFTERTLRLSAREDENALRAIHEFRAISRLLSALQDFTIQIADESPGVVVRDAGLKYVLLAASFRRLRCSTNDFLAGYYFDASAALRGVYENVLFLGTTLHGQMPDHAIFPTSGIDFEKMTTEEIEKLTEKGRRKLDKEIHDYMDGNNSGLSKLHQDDLRRFFRLLHLHVHGAKSTVVYMMAKWKKESMAPSFFPELSARHAGIFGSAATATGWCYLRVLAAVLIGLHTSLDVLEKYFVLDESFRFYVRETNNASAHAVLALVDKRFTFLNQSIQQPTNASSAPGVLPGN